MENEIADRLGAKMLKQIEKAKDIYAEYPRSFWTLVLITFVDRVGGAMLFPFFALYLTKKFEIGMTQVGVLFAAFSFSTNTIHAGCGTLPVGSGYWQCLAF